jgi:hypothetical protein
MVSNTSQISPSHVTLVNAEELSFQENMYVEGGIRFGWDTTTGTPRKPKPKQFGTSAAPGLANTNFQPNNNFGGNSGGYSFGGNSGGGASGLNTRGGGSSNGGLAEVVVLGVCVVVLARLDHITLRRDCLTAEISRCPSLFV